MEPAQAVNVLIQAVSDAQLKGVYSLQQVEVIITAIKTLTTPPDQQGPVGPMADKVVKAKA